jgi:hypothetical protein
VGSGAGAQTFEGVAVALSSDGNTLLVGNSSVGRDGVYIFTRSNGVWSQNGGPLAGETCAGSVALSADGKTALAGCGGAVVFIQIGGQWMRQAAIGSRSEVGANVGLSVALSADGNTALLSGNDFDDGEGAAVVYTRSNGVWTQQGGLITVNDIAGSLPPIFGTRAALSGDGNTALITGPGDNNGIGATWEFTRSNGVWMEQSKIVLAGTGAVAAISADSSTALLGGSEAVAFVQPWYVTMSHPGNLTQGQTGVPLTIRTGAQAPAGTGASVSLALPSAYSPTAITGPGWSCSLATLACSRGDSLTAGASFPPITLMLNVNQSAPSQVIGAATLTPGGSSAVVTTDDASILPPFTDVSPTDSFLPAIDLLRSFGITSGCGTTTYCPGDIITRAQMSVFVVRAVMGGDGFTYSNTPYFTDVPSSNLYFPWIQKMYELQITGGCGTYTFCPDDPVTRGQMAAFIIKARYDTSSAWRVSPTPVFTDVPSNDGFFVFIQKMQQLGITSGCGPTTYCPQESVTRGQMAVFLMRGAYNQFLPAGAPMLVWISPPNASPGQTVTVQIAGQNTNFSQGATTIDAGAAIKVSNIVVISPTLLTAQFAIHAGALFAPRTIIVNSGSEEAALPNGFWVQ